MIRIAERIFQLTVFVLAIFMVWGGGFFWREPLAGSFTRTNTYTLYRTVPPPPAGPRFCPLVDTGKYGLVGPCNSVPPFVWWLERRSKEKSFGLSPA